MKSFKEKSNDKIFYLIGLASFILILGIIIAKYVFHIEPTGILPECQFHKITHLYCPGCGGTRALRFLLEGKIIKSFLFHPGVFILAVFWLLFMSTHTIEWIMESFRKKRNLTPTKGSLLYYIFQIKGIELKPVYVYIFIGIVLIQCIIKNL